ncbi:MmcQ/YjbR family DNA-binding protein [bacterium]|nr:MmcQ/YjbR family DNA-binding protein [bacterium]
MDIEFFREYCLKKPGVTESTPFGPDTLVFKVCGKMFSLCSIDNFKSVNLKCDPEKAIELRAEYSAVSPGYHMNKKHWNTIRVDEDVTDEFLLEMTDDSYNLVFNKLSKSEKLSLGS